METGGISYQPPTETELAAMRALGRCPLIDEVWDCDRCGILPACLGNFNTMAAGRRTFDRWRQRQRVDRTVGHRDRAAHQRLVVPRQRSRGG